MGEVFRARDTKLNRDIALKIIPSAFASDPQRMSPFEREAHVLASLNHPGTVGATRTWGFAVSPDGERFVFVKGGATETGSLTVIQNWSWEFQR